jgi:hypothetical protein
VIDAISLDHSRDRVGTMPSEVSISGHDREPTAEELKRELAEALDRQTATAEVLRVISSSPRRGEPVFSAILERAVSFCNAMFGVIYRFDGEQIHVVAHHGARLPANPRALLSLSGGAPPWSAIDLADRKRWIG